MHPSGSLVATSAAARILVVDDDRAITDLVKTILEDCGYVVVSAQEPEEAVILLQQVAFDLVLTDAFARTTADMTATADIVAHAATTPVVLFTGHRIAPADARAHGFWDVIHKPFDLESFEQRVRTLLDARPQVSPQNTPLRDPAGRNRAHRAQAMV